MLVFRFGKFIVPTNFVNGSRLVGSEIRTKASPQPLAESVENRIKTSEIYGFSELNFDHNLVYLDVEKAKENRT
jgi:hypothetical protein